MKLNFILLIPLAMILFACETELTESENIAAKLQGQWQCEEYSSIFKSTNSFYMVNIEIYPTDSNKIVIENFYGLGDEINITVNIDGINLKIPDQIADDGSIIYGTGIITSNFSQIEWNYFVDIGDNLIDEVTATYTRIE